MPPVLERELRVQARLKRTYWLRFLTGLALAVALFVQMVDVGSLVRAMGLGGRAPDGPQLFASLHTIISLVLLFAAPLVAADSLSKERREGTLGLLALTPLKPFEVVIGKTLAHVIRLVSLWLLSVPLLLIPVLLGGVNWLDVKCAVSIELMVLLGGLAAGLVATSVADRWTTAAALALLLTWLVGQTLVTGTGLTLAILGDGKPGIGNLPDQWGVKLLGVSVIPWAAATGLVEGGFGPMLARQGGWIVPVLDYTLLAGLMFALSALGLALAIAAARVKRSFRSEPPTAKTEARRRRWRDVGWLRHAREFQRRRWLATNPACWLFGYSPFSDLSRWGWAVLVLTSPIVFALLSGGLDGGWLGLIVMQPLFLALGASLAAAASFRREIEEGTLELLLVSGLPATDLVSGRIRQLWSVTALALGLSAFWVILGAGFSRSSFEADLLLVWFAGAVSVFGVVPIGVRYAVRRLNPLHGWFWTLLTAGFPPLLLGAATATMFWGLRRFGDWNDGVGRFAYGVGFTLTQFGLAWTWRWLAANDLHTRLYMLKPFQRRPT
jgi:ABC-type transport system involved in multi-copper enzyme maturation permease subunit